MDTKTKILLRTTLAAVTAHSTLFWNASRLHHAAPILVSGFLVATLLIGLLALRVRRAPLVIAPVLVVGAISLWISAPAVTAFALWSVHGFAP